MTMTYPELPPPAGGELVPFTGSHDTSYEIALDDAAAPGTEMVHPPGG